MRRLKAEWEPHKLVLLAFPHEETDWARQGNLQQSYAPFVRIAQAIAYSQSVYILCRDKESIADLFCSKNNMIFIEADYDDTWTRDYGPLSVEEEGKKKLLDFRFDGWGGKFDAAKDDAVNRFLHSKGYFGTTPMESIDFVLEGGSIESDGAGTILATSRCLCNPNRNGGLSKEEVEARLRQSLGAKRILWLDHGYLAGDDTDSHIDTLARFVDEETIAYIRCDDPDDEHYEELWAMKEQLRSFRTQRGDPYRLVALPMAPARHDAEGRRLPTTYANFLIANRALLYPSYGDRTLDRRVGEIFADLFPGREIIPIPSSLLVTQGGSLHCSTMQVDY
ncbi:agmatine deiminase family protein [Nitratifractor sp.]